MKQNKKYTVVGITGGVGSGKSTVVSMLKEFTDVIFLHCDEMAKSLYTKGSSVLQQIAEQFGDECIDATTGEANKKEIFERAFKDDEAVKKINSIVHPAVFRLIEQEFEKAENEEFQGYIVIESAIMFEAGLDRLCDEIWYIRTSKEIRKQRLALSRGYSDEKSEDIISKQLDDEMFLKRCDVVIDNSSDDQDSLKEQIKKALKNDR